MGRVRELGFALWHLDPEPVFDSASLTSPDVTTEDPYPSLDHCWSATPATTLECTSGDTDVVIREVLSLFHIYLSICLYVRHVWPRCSNTCGPIWGLNIGPQQ